MCLLAILAPTAALAMPCCDPVEDSACCDPGGDCPTAPTGECMLTAGSAPVVVVSAPSLEAPTVAVAALLDTPPNAAGIASATISGPAPHVPLYIDLHTLRN